MYLIFLGMVADRDRENTITLFHKSDFSGENYRLAAGNTTESCFIDYKAQSAIIKGKSVNIM